MTDVQSLRSMRSVSWEMEETYVDHIAFEL